MTGKEQIIIDINKYFVELIDKGGGTVGYTVMFPERLLIEIIKQNKQLARKTQEYEELKERIKCNCFDPKSNNNRCISYNRIVEDYKRDLKRLENKIAECEELKEEIKALEKINSRNDQELLRRLTYASNAERQRDRYLKALEEIEKAIKINCEEICGRKFEDCNDFLCSSKNILDIINKAKGKEYE